MAWYSARSWVDSNSNPFQIERLKAIESYKTIKSLSEGLLKEKSSKFFGYALPVSRSEDVKRELERLKKEHHSARHWCYAYRLTPEGSVFRANDDGEPSHSAGDPILRQIDSMELTDVLVVVVRYFGGIKLGVGGLIQAYGGAARLALEAANIIEREIKEELKITFGYEDMSEVMRILKRHDAQMMEHEFLGKCWIRAEIPRRGFTPFFNDLSLMHRVILKKSGSRD